MAKIKEMVDVNTVIGDPITAPDGTTVIPVSRVSYGFAGGGSDLPSKAQPEKGLFAGGSGAGITIQPIAFLVISNGNVRILQIEPYVSSVDRVVASVPDVVDKIAGLFNKDKKDKEDEPWQVVIFAKDTLCFAGGRFCVGQSAGFGRDGGVRKRFGVCRRTV